MFVCVPLQHHDEDTIVYDEGEWTYVKGALQTIDRPYGAPIDSEHTRHNALHEHMRAHRN